VNLRKFFAFLGLLGVVYLLALQHGVFDHSASGAQAATREPPAVAAPTCDDTALTDAYRDHRSRVEVCGQGVIAKVLRDDTVGSRHQRFIVRVAQGQTVLIAYNFDIAPRIEGLHSGSPIQFVGEYEWNGQGGVVHWTHHDPSGRHAPGWILYGGKEYR